MVLDGLHILILAAGKGTRMQSSFPKCLHLYHGKPFLYWILQSLSDFTHISVIIQKEQESLFLHQLDLRFISIPFQYIYQSLPLRGTGHALQCWFESIQPQLHERSSVLVINGDMPNIQTSSILSFLRDIDRQIKSNSIQMAIVAGIRENPFSRKGYGRIFVEEIESRIYILEEKDCSDQQLQSLSLCNLGLYWFSCQYLKENLSKLTLSPSQQELYITQLTEWVPLSRIFVHVVQSSNLRFFEGINTIKELENLEKDISIRNHLE